MGAAPGVKTVRPHAMAAAALVAVACYLNTFGNQFAFDDLEVIVRNPLVSGEASGDLGRTFSSHYWAHLRPAGNLYRPLAILSFALNHAVSGLATWSYHAVNILLHAAASALTAALGLRLGLGPGGAMAAGALFAAHPVHTEAVAGIVGRAELMSACGVLAAWLVHLRPGRTGMPRAVGIALLYAGALLSKENAIVLPALMAAGDLAARRRKEARFRPAAAGYAACAAVTVAWLALRAAALPSSAGADETGNPFLGVPGARRVLTALHVAARWGVLLVFPARLSADHSYDQIPILAAPDAMAVAGALLLASIAAAGAALALRGSPASAAPLGFLAAAAPVSNLIVPIGTVMAERLLYLPSVFFCLAVPWMWGWLSGRIGLRGRAAGRWGTALVSILVAAASARTVVRNTDWKDQLTLFSATVSSSPRSAKARYNLGVALEDAGRPDQALEQYRAALAIHPGDARSRHNAALLLAARSPDEAARHLEEALRHDPGLGGARASLGAVYARLGRAADAERVLREAVAMERQAPERRRALYNLGSLLLEQGRAAEAVTHLEPAAALDPGDADGRYQLGLAYLHAGRPGEALAELQEALAIAPGLHEARVPIALAWLRRGDTRQAAREAALARDAGVELPPALRDLAGEERRTP